MRLIDLLNQGPVGPKPKPGTTPPDPRILPALPKTVKELMELTGLSDYVVRKDLAKLMAAGEVVKEASTITYRNGHVAKYVRRNKHVEGK